MKVPVLVDVSDLSYTMGSMNEREEVLKFVTELDMSMADVDFTLELIRRLADSLTEDLEEETAEIKTSVPTEILKHGTFVEIRQTIPLSAVIRALSEQDPYVLVYTLAKASQLQAEKDMDAPLSCECGHPRGVHNRQDGLCGADAGVRDCMACSVREKEDPSCTACGCVRSVHLVNVGGERTGCFNHLDCDEWKQEEK